MRKNAIVLHGVTDRDEVFSEIYPSMSNSHWLPWLQKQLVKEGFNCQTPEMPDVWAPDYNEWRAIFEGFSVTAQTVLVGHSAGCGFFLKWLSENDVKVAKLVMVAPWLDPNRTRGDFLSCTLASNLHDRIGEMHILHSDDDGVAIHTTVDTILAAYPHITMHRFAAHGHFCFNDMKTEKFPELLKLCL